MIFIGILMTLCAHFSSAKDYSHSFGSNPSDGFTAAVHRVFSR